MKYIITTESKEVIVGSRVKVSKEYFEHFIVGHTGVVKYMKENDSCAVEFEPMTHHLHNCSGYCKEQCGWWIDKVFLEVVQQ